MAQTRTRIIASKSILRTRNKDVKPLKAPPIDTSVLSQTILEDSNRDGKRFKSSSEADSDTEHNSDASIVSVDTSPNK